MQITRQADYALRAMLYLAHHNFEESPSTKKEKPPSTSEIAKSQQIPPSFLAKIISQLSIAGLIVTSRGANGGVKLARKPEEISLLEVVEAIDGPITLNECTVNPKNCSFGENCPIHEVWCETQAELVRKLKQATFDKLIEREDNLLAQKL